MFITSWLSAIRKGLLRVSSKPSRRRPRQSYGQYACELEVLEDRLMLTNFAVDDDWAGTTVGDTVTLDDVDYIYGVTAFSTIQAGVNAAEADILDPDTDTVFVAAGTYDESVSIDDSLNLLGANAGIAWDGTRGDESVVNGGAGTAISISAANVTIDGFTIGGSAGIVAAGTDLSGTTIANNIIAPETLLISLENALSISGATATGGVTVTGNQFAESTSGVVVDGGAEIDSISGNSFVNNTFGISVGNGHVDSISDNTFSQSLFSISMLSAAGQVDSISDNSFSNGTYGVRITSGQIGSISGNTFSNVTHAISLGGGQVDSISGNTFSDNTHAIEINGGRVDSISGNLFEADSATDYLSVTGSGTVGTVSNNSFEGTILAVDNQTANTIDASGNWWGTAVESEIQARFVGSVDYSPWLNAGTNLVPMGDPGFTGDFSKLTVSAASPQAAITPSAIQEAIDLATTGGTIYVLAGLYTAAPGTYVGNINKSLTLLGAQAGTDARNRNSDDESVIQGTTVGLFVGADNVTIDGFTLTSDAGSLGQKIGIQTSGLFGNYDISNNIITGNTIGLYLNSDDGGALVEQNWIKNNNLNGSAGLNGIYSDQGLQNAVINENLFAGNPYAAITLDSAPVGSGNITISNNVSDGAFQVHRMTGVDITGNTITAPNGAGVYIGGGVSDVDIGGNTITMGNTGGPAAIGIANEFGFGANSAITIHNNTITTTANRAGLVIDSDNVAYADADPLVVSENAFLGTGVAINSSNSVAMQIDADFNYWGTSDPVAINARIIGAQAAGVDFSVLLDHGNQAPNDPGFQADYSSLTVQTLGAQIEPVGRIAQGIASATLGGTVHVAAGSYDENVILDRQVNLIGAGSEVTTVNSQASDTPVLQIRTGGTDTESLTVQGISFVGATGAPGNNSSGILIYSATPLSWITLNDVASTNNAGQGLSLASDSSLSHILVENSDFSNNGQNGVRIATSVTTVEDLVFDNITADNNFLAGMVVYGNSTNSVRNITLSDSSFSGNSTSTTDQGISVIFYNIDGDESDINLTNVTVNESTANANYGIFFKGIVDGGSGDPLSGTSGIHLTNVTVSGTLHDYGDTLASDLVFKDFIEVNTVATTFANVQLNATAAAGITLINVPFAAFSTEGLVFGANLDQNVAYVGIDEIDLTSADDTAIVSLDAQGHLILTLNDDAPILLEGITSLQVNGLAGNDYLIVDQVGGNVFDVLAGGVHFDGGEGLQDGVAFFTPDGNVDYTPSGTVAGTGSLSVTYLPDDFTGEDLLLSDIITFVNVSGVAVAGADLANLTTPDGGDDLRIGNIPSELLPAGIPLDAVGVTGTVGTMGTDPEDPDYNPGVPMASFVVWDVTQLDVYTGTNNAPTAEAPDTVTIGGLATSQIDRLHIFTTDSADRTALNEDAINVAGPVSGISGIVLEASHLGLAGSITTTPEISSGVVLVSNSGIVQTAGTITTGELILNGTGAFDLYADLTGNGNNVQSLYADINGSLQFRNLGGFTLVNQTSEGSPAIDTNGNNVTLWSQTGAITIADGIVADEATVVLLSNGVYESTPNGTITADSLLLFATGTGDFTLSQKNQVSSIAASTYGSLYFLNNLATTVATVNNIVGISSVAGNVQLVTGPQLTLEQAVSAASGTVTLQSYGGFSQGADGDVSALNLLLIGVGDYDLSAGTNAVGTFAASVNGGISYKNTGAFQVGTVAGVAGINTQGHDLTLSSVGFLTISQAIVADESVVILDVGGVYENAATASITAGSLALSGTGDFTLPQANKVSNFASSTSGSLYFLNNLVTTVTTVNGIIGVSSTTGSVQLVTGPQLILEQKITAASGTVTLQSYSGVSQESTGTVSAQSLLLIGIGNYDLSVAENAVGTIAGFVNGSINYINTDAFRVGTVAGVAGINTQGHNLLLGSGGMVTISQAIVAENANIILVSAGAVEDTASGTITASNLQLLASDTGTFNFSQVNDVDTLTGAVQGAINFTDVDDLTVGNGGIGTGNGNLSLLAAHVIVTGIINAGNGATNLFLSGSVGGIIEVHAQVTSLGGITLQGTPGKDLIVLNANATSTSPVQLLGGDGADIFMVRPSLSTVVNVNGGVVSTGNTLIYNFPGHTPTQLGNSLQTQGFAAITYTGIGSVLINPNQAALDQAFAEWAAA